MDEYERIADWYARVRIGSMGVTEVTALAASLPSGGGVLDVGCGNGLPLTGALVDAGCTVVGVDSSSRMLDYFRRNLPDVPAVRAAVQALPFRPRSFDAAVAWGVLFHLPHDEQALAIASVARALRNGGTFLFTAGDRHGSIDGEPMNGVRFRYHSFTVDGYRTLLADYGLTLRSTHTDEGENRYYLAVRR